MRMKRCASFVHSKQAFAALIFASFVPLSYRLFLRVRLKDVAKGESIAVKDSPVVRPVVRFRK